MGLYLYVPIVKHIYNIGYQLYCIYEDVFVVPMQLPILFIIFYKFYDFFYREEYLFVEESISTFTQKASPWFTRFRLGCGGVVVLDEGFFDR